MTDRSQVQAFGGPVPKTWDDYEQGCLSTYRGGHHEERELSAFRHGMGTVFNLLRREFPPAERIRNLESAIAANEAHANEWIDKLTSDIKRLKGLVRDAYYEGLEAGHCTTTDVSAENLWADSEARAELGDD